MRHDDSPVATDLVLVGGGHSHLFVLEKLAMEPLPGLRVTLVTRDLHTAYSGMLPGFVAGHYDYDDAHIDLLPLARRAGARVIHTEVEGIDCSSRRIAIRGRPPLDYDLLSINIGSRPTAPDFSARDGNAIEFAVKPVDIFIESWHRLERRLADAGGQFRLAIVGAGAGGIELALSLQHRAAQWPAGAAALQLSLLTDDDRLLPGHNAATRRAIESILRERGIDIHYRHRVDRFDDGSLYGDFEPPLAADGLIWVTNARAAAWLNDSGLALDEGGFIAVNASLQSLSHDDVFAAGDIAAVEEHPRPKSGVFAVRQGLPLARNLLRRARGLPLQPFTPQRQFLSLISTGDRRAVASRGRWAFGGRWCWWLKDRIDRRFVRRFSEFPAMAGETGDTPDTTPMHCGGCGSKVGSRVLEQVLERVAERYGIEITGGFDQADDAAVIEPPAGMQLLQSVDHFRSFVDDPWLFGRIAANHALGDLFAMGVEAHSALVIANVVYASEDKQLQDLYQLMSGVVETLQAHGCKLLGGHSGEAAQMSCGLSVNGFARREDLLQKQGMRAGDAVILTKPIGSGVLFAADMRGRTRGDWLDGALAQMLVSSLDAALCLRRHGAGACTDVTGFGLAGHLLEMARASACGVDLDLDCLPLMAGAVELSEQGIGSSLLPQNRRIRHAVDDTADFARHPAYPLIYDPQTAGGLLASVPRQNAAACLRQLREAGYDQACVIGRVTAAVPTTAGKTESRLRLCAT